MHISWVKKYLTCKNNPDDLILSHSIPTSQWFSSLSCTAVLKLGGGGLFVLVLWGCSCIALHCFFHFLVISSIVVFIFVFSNPFLSVSASIILEKFFSLSCIIHLDSVMILKSDIYSLKNPLLLLLKPCTGASKFP